MIVDLVLVAAGLGLLVLGGEYLVRGAVNLSLRLGIPPLIVGLTVVAFGTSAPEMIVSVAAVLGGSPGLALGNVVGSNTANVLLVVGLPALLTGIVTKDLDMRASWLMMIGASVLAIALCFMGPLRWWHGLVLLAGLAAMIWTQIRDARAHRASNSEADLEGVQDGARWLHIIAWLALGLIALPVGANLLVKGATNIALAFGISETVIGLTLVAVGTSLPELATSVASALRGRADLALGNVVGSNIFNILSILGVTSLIGAIPVDPVVLHRDLWVMLGSALILGPFLWWRLKISRGAGVVALGLYAAYIWALI